MIVEGTVMGPRHRPPTIPFGFMAIEKNVYECAGSGGACPGAPMLHQLTVQDPSSDAVPSRAIDAVPSRALDAVPSRALDAVPSRALDAVPSRAVDAGV